MTLLNLDPHGSHTIRWPQRPADIIALAEQYIAYESTLSALQQLPLITTSLLQPRLDAARAAVNAAAVYDADRGSSAETLKQGIAQLVPLMERIYTLLRAKNVDNLATMEYWGFVVVEGTRFLIVRKPRRRTQLIQWLTTYVAKETSLPPAERITNPSLTQMEALLETLQTALAARNTGRNQREVSIATRNQELSVLLSILQRAAASRVHLFYNGYITPDLQHWGYIVEGRARPRPNGNGASGGAGEIEQPPS